MKKMADYWQDARVVSVAPLSEERVSPFTGQRHYLTTGGLDENRIAQLEPVSYENRPTRADLVVRNGDVFVARMKDTLKVLQVSPELNGMIVSTGFAVFCPTPKVLPGYLYFFLRSAKFQSLKDKYAQGSTQKAINNTDLRSITLPLPPIPVQQRIAQILQKADEIRRKRQECINILTNMTTSIFERFFGRLEGEAKKWPVNTVESVLSEEPANGKSPSKKGVKCEAEVLTLTAVRGGRLNIEHRKRGQFDANNLERFFIRCNDTYVVRGNGNIELLGRMGLYDGSNEEIVFPDTLIRLRFNNDLVLNEFMAYLWDTQLIRRQILSRAKTTSGTHKISQKDILSFRFPLPPMELQKRFLITGERYFETLEAQRSSGDTEDALLSSLLSRAYTGQLTAEWEEANAEWIAQQVELQERLPRLLLLALIREKALRVEKVAQAAVLVTALMKYAFLIQMEGQSRQGRDRRFYDFVPYHYGPFAKEVYTDLEKLHQEGLIRVRGTGWGTGETGASEFLMAAEEQAPYGDGSSRQTESNRIEIGLNHVENAEKILAALPDDLKEDVAAVIDTYGDLDHNALLKTVYEKYPAYAKKSRLHKRSD